MGSKKIHKSRGYLDSIVFTGAIQFGARLSTPDGWVRLSGLTIGSATSGATERANDDCEDLFKLLWNDCTDTECPVVGGRGVSADADWSANKQITLWDSRNEVFAGLDYDNGLGLSNRLTLLGCGIDGSVLGTDGGSQNHVLVVGELAAHTHVLSAASAASAGAHTHTVSGKTTSNGAHSHNCIWSSSTTNFIYIGSGAGYNELSESMGGGGQQLRTTANGDHTHTLTSTSAASNGDHTHTVSGTINSMGSDSAHNNTQPTRICSIFIKL